MVSVLDAREDIPFQSDDGWEKNKQNQDLGVEKKNRGLAYRLPWNTHFG